MGAAEIVVEVLLFLEFAAGGDGQRAFPIFHIPTTLQIDNNGNWTMIQRFGLHRIPCP